MPSPEHDLAALRAQVEALTASNREYQTINEELQSANEALLASREELQSVNQELQAINGELAERLSELAATYDECAETLAATRIATLFLDNGGRIRTFTPRMAELFALEEADLERPPAALGDRLPYAELEADIAAMLQTLELRQRRITTRDGAPCLVRVLPQRSRDGFVAGAVLTFLEID